jgi:hypothetical protein
MLMKRFSLMGGNLIATVFLKFTFLVSFILLFVVYENVAEAYIPVEDHTPPTLLKVELSKTMVNAGETVTVYITAEDDASGVLQPYIYFMQAGMGHSSIPETNIKKDEQGRYVGQIKVPENAPTGKWTIDDIEIYDRAHNIGRFVHSSDYSAEFTVLGDHSAIEVDFSPSQSFTVNVNETVNITAATPIIGTKTGSGWYYSGLDTYKIVPGNVPPYDQVVGNNYVSNGTFTGYVPGVYVIKYSISQQTPDGRIQTIPGTQTIKVVDKDVSETEGVILGKITMADGGALVGANVYAYSSTSSMEAVKTDKNGFYRIKGKTPDTYTISFYTDDWKYNGQQRNVDVLAGKIATVNFLHNQERPPSTAPLESNITVTNLQAGTTDLVHVTGLWASGGVIRVYDSATGGRLLGEAAYHSQTFATVFINQLGITAGEVYVSVTYANDGKSESLRTKKAYNQEDTIAPITTIHFESSSVKKGDWYTSDVTVSLSPEDESGVEKTLYKMNNGDWVQYTEDFILQNEGSTIIEFMSIDKNGNEENVKSEMVKIDKTAPSTTVSPVNDGWYHSDVTLNLESEDSLSGVAKTQYAVNGGEWLDYNSKINITNEGINKVNFRSIDKAGNVDEMKSVEVKIDKTNPSLKVSFNPSEIKTRNHKLVPIKSFVVTEDSLSGISSVELVVSNQSDNGVGDGNTEQDIQEFDIGKADTDFLVRAETTGNKDRIYTVTYKAIDHAGNSTIVSGDIVVKSNNSNKKS